ELLAEFGSDGEVAVTLTVFVIVPFAVGLTEMLIVALPDAAKAPREQATSRFSGLTLQFPWLADALPKPAFFGSWSLTVTPAAPSGPLSVTVIEYRSVCPTCPVEGAVLTICRSAEDTRVNVYALATSMRLNRTPIGLATVQRHSVGPGAVMVLAVTSCSESST